MQKIPLLIVTSREEDVEELKEILQETSWELTAAANAEAPAAPIVLLDRESAGSDWQATMHRLLKTRRHTCVVLVSNVSDQYLWEEVVHHGGFDVLTRPFRKDQVLSMLLFAYAHSRAPWPKAVNSMPKAAN